MLTIYNLRADKDYIARVQEATTTTEDYGIEPTHGLFGSPEWWQHIREGTLRVHRLRGTIARLFGDFYPGFVIRSDTGEESRWGRDVDDAAFTSLYTVGRPIEVDYVIQRHRPFFFGRRTETNIPIEIRVDENA
jgi:hypothetical protein